MVSKVARHIKPSSGKVASLTFCTTLKEALGLFKVKVQ
jgi:hypothetical protein